MPLHQLQQLFHLFHPGGPAGGNADNGVGIIVLLPEAELGLAFQRGQLLVGQHDEHLIRGRIHEERIALFGQSLLEHGGGLNGIFADGLVQVIGEQHIELDAQQTALCQQSALLLDLVIK